MVWLAASLAAALKRLTDEATVAQRAQAASTVLSAEQRPPAIRVIPRKVAPPAAAPTASPAEGAEASTSQAAAPPAAAAAAVTAVANGAVAAGDVAATPPPPLIPRASVFASATFAQACARLRLPAFDLAMAKNAWECEFLSSVACLITAGAPHPAKRRAGDALRLSPGQVRVLEGIVRAAARGGGRGSALPAGAGRATAPLPV